jgi:mRNA-degrading endonuclease toxin of MazEF toxin-antitoxin module
MSYNDIQSTIDIHSGNIYLADLGENIGDELSGNFSVLVFQGNDNYLNNSSLVFVIPIGTKTEGNPYQIYFNEFDLI